MDKGKLGKDIFYFHLRGQKHESVVDGRKVSYYDRVLKKDVADFVLFIHSREIKDDRGELFRPFDEFGEQIAEYGEGSVLFKLIREIDRGQLQGATFAFNRSGEWNFSICIAPDGFSRKKGRLIAGGRLRKHGPWLMDDARIYVRSVIKVY
jgi:hypothetical protein